MKQAKVEVGDVVCIKSDEWYVYTEIPWDNGTTHRYWREMTVDEQVEFSRHDEAKLREGGK